MMRIKMGRLLLDNYGCFRPGSGDEVYEALIGTEPGTNGKTRSQLLQQLTTLFDKFTYAFLSRPSL